MKSIVRLAHVYIGNVRVNLGRRDVGVSQQRLHRTGIGAMLHQVRAEAVPQGMRRDVRHAGRSRMGLNDCPRSLARHRAPAVEK